MAMRTNRRGWILVVSLWAILGGVLGKHALDVRDERSAEEHRALVRKIVVEGSYISAAVWNANRQWVWQQRCGAGRKITN